MFSACLILVAALWGCTNPLLKKNTREIVKIKAKSPIVRFLLELRYLLTNYKVISDNNYPVFNYIVVVSYTNGFKPDRVGVIFFHFADR